MVQGSGKRGVYGIYGVYGVGARRVVGSRHRRWSAAKIGLRGGCASRNVTGAEGPLRPPVPPPPSAALPPGPLPWCVDSPSGAL
jgi:hypothetical protein